METDCSATDDYETLVLQPLESGMPQWYSYGDDTPGGSNAFELRELSPPRCDSTAALVLSCSGHVYWGAGFGEYQTATAPVNASEYEGVSFWARATSPSRGFTMNIQDPNTIEPPDPGDGTDPTDDPDYVGCHEADLDDVLAGTHTVSMSGQIVPIGGELPSASDCGNGFERVVEVTPDWIFYHLPFESFRQTAEPNLRPEGLDRSEIRQFGIAVPADSDLELWIDDLGFYRTLAAEPAAATSQ